MRVSAILLLAAVSSACGTSGGSAAPGPPAVDAGANTTFYPAFVVDAPKVISDGGPTLRAPVIVTITWPDVDSNAAGWEDEADGIGATTYWKQALSEYGVGPATSGPSNHVRLAGAPPATMMDTDLVDILIAQLGGSPTSDAGVADAASLDAAVPIDAGAAWPAPTMAGGSSQTIYTFIVPPTLAIIDTRSMQSYCAEDEGGYHHSAVANGVEVAYAVVFECPPIGTQPPSSTQDVEYILSHELAEAATDPFLSHLGYMHFDDAHFAWAAWNAFGGELADACEPPESLGYQESAAFPHLLARVWSNNAATAGRHPCAPRPAEPYYNVTLFPDEEQNVTLPYLTTKGFKAAVGHSVTFKVGFFSDAPTTPFTVTGAVDSDSYYAFPNGAANVTIDQPTGQNGHTANVTVTPTMAGQPGFQVIVLTSKNPDLKYAHYLPVLIGNQ
jgi:hypothetical protein